LTPETSRSKSSPEQEIEIDQNSQFSPVPASTDPPIAEQNGSPPLFNQPTPFAPQQATLPAKKSTDYTVGWICAIVTEYAAAQEFLDEEHEAPDFVSPGDTNHYTLGRIGEHNVVIAVLPDGEYGTAAAAMVATNMQNSFPNVRIGLLVGIGGGVPSERHDIRLGDVVVSAPRDGKGGVFQYDFGKTMQGLSFQHTRFLNQPPTALRTALTGLQARYKRRGHCIESTINSILNRNPGLRHEYGRPPGNADTLFRAEVIHNTKGCVEFCAGNPLNIVQRRARTTSEPNPAIHYGLIASANRVMKDASVRDQLAAESDILCFEMEAAGLMNQFPCLVIRGICDYSDSHKNKEWQGFAAMTAAAYAKDVLHQIPPSLVEAEKKISDILLGI
jgi:nucleoside phosphorylase